MKPNGRRRWRKWAKKGLDIVTGYTSRRLNKRQYWNRWRRHRNDTDRTGPLPPLPASVKPFTMRSLVGMSFSARKRHWHKNSPCPEDFDAARKTDDEIRAFFARWQAPYRIGERLRPCRFCRGPEEFDRCRGVNIASSVQGAHIRGECVFCRTCADAALTLKFELGSILTSRIIYAFMQKYANRKNMKANTKPNKMIIQQEKSLVRISLKAAAELPITKLENPKTNPVLVFIVSYDLVRNSNRLMAKSYNRSTSFASSIVSAVFAISITST